MTSLIAEKLRRSYAEFPSLLDPVFLKVNISRDRGVFVETEKLTLGKTTDATLQTLSNAPESPVSVLFQFWVPSSV